MSSTSLSRGTTGRCRFYTSQKSGVGGVSGMRSLKILRYQEIYIMSMHSIRPSRSVNGGMFTNDKILPMCPAYVLYKDYEIYDAA